MYIAKHKNCFSLYALVTLHCLCFVSARVQAEPWKFLIFGDTRGNNVSSPVDTNILAELASEITNQRPAFVAIPGDLVLQGDVAAYQIWSNTMAPVYAAGIGVYPVRGNHDCDNDTNAFINCISPSLPTNGPAGEIGLTYAVSYSNVLLLALDEFITPEQVNTNWILAVLATNSSLHVFAMGHEAAFKVYHDDCMQDFPDARDAFWRILSNASSRVYFTAHDHFYDHMRADDGDGDPSNDTHQFLVGTGGAPLYPDDVYDGQNDGWTPTRVFHEEQYGYVAVVIDGPTATLTWYHRTGTNAYAPTSDVFSYTLAPALVPTYSNGALTLTWRGGGSLESAPDPGGPWTVVDQANSPYVITNFDAAQDLYRVRLR